MSWKNGKGDRLEAIHTEIEEVKEGVGEVKESLKYAIYDLSNAVNRIADKFEIFLEGKFVPLKLAMLMFIFAMAGNTTGKVIDRLLELFLTLP